MESEDVPDELIWHHPARLEEWFDAVKNRRMHGHEDVPDADEEEGMTGNQLVREMIGD